MSAIIVSIDIETTGVDHKENQIIEIGAVIDNWNDPRPCDELPTFQSFIQHNRYVCAPYAAWLNYRILGKLGGAIPLEDGESMGTPGEVFSRFYSFLTANGLVPNRRDLIHFNPAGKNYASFDNLFLNELPEWTNRFRPSRRSFDPAILYYDNTQDDTLPDTKVCMKEAGIEGESTHRAVDDALCVIRLLRLKMLGIS